MEWCNFYAHYISCLIKGSVTNKCWFFMCLGSLNNRILLHTVLLIVLIGRHLTSITPSIWPVEAYWGRIGTRSACPSRCQLLRQVQHLRLTKCKGAKFPSYSPSGMWSSDVICHHQFDFWGELHSLCPTKCNRLVLLVPPDLVTNPPSKVTTDLYLDQNVTHSCCCSSAGFC